MLNEKSNKGDFVDKAKVFGAIVTNLLKAFNCLSHELMIWRLSADWSSLNSLTLQNRAFNSSAIYYSRSTHMTGHNSQENASTGVSSNTGVFPWIFLNF